MLQNDKRPEARSAEERLERLLGALEVLGLNAEIVLDLAAQAEALQRVSGPVRGWYVAHQRAEEDAFVLIGQPIPRGWFTPNWWPGGLREPACPVFSKDDITRILQWGKRMEEGEKDDGR